MLPEMRGEQREERNREQDAGEGQRPEDTEAFAIEIGCESPSWYQCKGGRRQDCSYAHALISPLMLSDIAEAGAGSNGACSQITRFAL